MDEDNAGNEEALDEQQLEGQRKREVSAVLSFVVALLVVIVGFIVGALMMMNRPEPETQQLSKPVPTVDAVRLQRGDHRVRISTQGVVESRREVRLATQVGGRIERISEQLVEGGRVSQDEPLVWIERADLEAARDRAISTLKEAELALEIEKARAIQATNDWEKLGKGEAPELVLRKPQIEAAEAKITSAREELERAERDILRATIRAPFAGRVRMAGVEVGAVVTPGTAVAEIYSDTELEVRLPFPLEDFGFLREGERPRFDLRARLGGEEQRWPAELVRIEGEVDRATLSGYGIAKVSGDPQGGYPPVGLFVEARVPGETLADVVELPRAAVRQSDEVWLAVKPAGEDRLEGVYVLEKREVTVLRSLRHTLVARLDFPPDSWLVLTRLETAARGDEVKVGENEEAPE